MEKRALVAYASKHGSTREIAEKIAHVLSRSGLPVDVSPCHLVADPASYGAVVFGSAVYFGNWRRKAVRFLEAWEKLPSAPPLWLFFSGPTGKGDPKVQAMNGQGIPDRRRSLIEHMKPRDIAFFHGKVEAAGLHFLEKWAIRNVQAPMGDFRDWDAIAAWAGGIADALTALTASQRKA
jgi:menaquinone-dependent protoporphyrinogen oxidase